MDDGKWAFDTAGWRMRDVRRYANILKQAAADLDFQPVYEMLAGVVTAWPFAGAPGEAASYDDLTPEEWMQVLTEVQGHLSGRFRQS